MRLHSFRAAFAGLALSAFVSFPAFAQTRIHILDVGQGLSILAESQGHYLLYDGGDADQSSYVVAYLKEQGVSSLDYVIASHYDSDHLNGVVGALHVFPASQIFAPDYETDTRVFRSFQSVIASQALPAGQPTFGDVYCLGDASFQILSPSGGGYKKANDYSIAIRLTDGDTSFLITGDAEAESEARITASGLPLESTVYVAGHHGSASSTSWELLQKAVPEFAVISCGTGNSYGHPHAETMEKLQSMEIPVFRTDLQGVLIAETDGTALQWNQDPCNDYTPGDPGDAVPGTQKNQSDTTAGAAETGTNLTAPKYQTTDGTGVSSESSSTPEDPASQSKKEQAYVLNTSSKKIHRPSCSSVSQIKDKNKKSVTEDRGVLISQGYSPCKNCNP